MEYQVSPIVDSPGKYIHGKVWLTVIMGCTSSEPSENRFYPTPSQVSGMVVSTHQVWSYGRQKDSPAPLPRSTHVRISGRGQFNPRVSMMNRRAVGSTTRLLFFHGEELTLNVQAPQWVQDPDGKPHQGYTFEDCIPFTGDDLFWKPKWKNHPSVSEFMEKVVRLEVKLFNGRIYSIRGNFIPIRSGDYRRFKDHGIPPNPTYEQ